MIDIKEIQYLYDKPINYNFNDAELDLIIRYFKSRNNRYRVKYAFYRKDSSKGLYITFLYDLMNDSVRRSGVENYWEVFSQRAFTDLEYLEFAQNFGSQHNRFKVYYYQIIECLIFDDSKYNISTPEAFIQEAIKRGYTNSNFDLIKWERSFKKNQQFSSEPKQLKLL